MRYRELNEARPWKTYHGRKHPCVIASPDDLGDCQSLYASIDDAEYGFSTTGRSQVFFGYFVRICAFGHEWVGEDRHSLRKALLRAAEAARSDGWILLALGCTEFKETGLSANSGYGYHPAFPDRHVHMFEPIPRQRDGD